MKCPVCSTSITTDCYKNSYLILCKNCQNIFSTKSNISLQVRYNVNYNDKIFDNLPEFNINDIVICIDPSHMLFLEIGKIQKIEKLFVKVEFNNGITLWVPLQIMELLPKEWL